ncbi:MAG: DUF4159 domain-containing protein [Pseudomonadota bacterium]
MIGFAIPAVLFALLALPAIYWLLRLTPPRPVTEVFPPLQLLLKLQKKEETPAKSPWWLTLLRIAMAALVIIALARPLLNPQVAIATGSGPLLIAIDNDWTSGADWEARVRTAEAVLEQAANAGQPVALTATIAAATTTIVRQDATTAFERLRSLAPIAARADRAGAIRRLTATLGEENDQATLVLIGPSFAELTDADIEIDPRITAITRFAADNGDQTILTGVENRTDGLAASFFHLGAERPLTLIASDLQGRQIGEAQIIAGGDAAEDTALFDIPFELRNDIATIRIEGAQDAGGVYLLDDSNRRRRVALLSGIAGAEEQPLLSPLFYIERALSPFADLIEARTGDLTTDIPEIVNQGPAVIVLADIGVLPNVVRDDLDQWLDAGGTLIRFAGPRLAASTSQDPYLPVELRAGERELGGALSWTEPQRVGPYAPNGPFADLNPPREVTVTRQILAEPSIELEERTWASLEDGTPLVTAAPRGRGTIVLFHVTAEARWSNLPITGSFVEILKRVTDLAANTAQGTNIDPATPDQEASLPPLRMLTASGDLTTPADNVRPLALASADAYASFENPAGTYGTPESFIAKNLFEPGDILAPFALPAAAPNFQSLPLLDQRQSSLAGWVFLAAFALLLIDTLAVLWINGYLQQLRSGLRTAGAAAAMAIIVTAAMAPEGRAQDNPPDNDSRPGDEQFIQAIDQTSLAFVITGDTIVDETSEAGISGLSRFLASRTAFEPGEPVGVDIERDELAFYPLIYFPISVSVDMPSETAIARLDSYMQAGGTILFDTRDDLTSSLSSGTTAETARLREILADLNVPPLEPVPEDHVLTKAFYILESFPGRYSGSPLWVEATPLDEQEVADRPVRTGDGVTPIMITGNDFASAWALDAEGRPLYSMASGDPLQRIYAFRTGVNIMMYMLTGNYKADQVHVPALLERLGQ